MASFTDAQIADEHFRRTSLKQKSESAAILEAQMKSWKDHRPRVAVVGRAYGFRPGVDWGKTYSGEDHAQIETHVLATVHMRGNMGRDYEVKFQSTAAVQTCFHNCWTREDQNALEAEVRAIAEKWVAAKINDPVVVLSLIGIGGDVRQPQWVQEELHRATVERMSEFSVDELEDAVVRLHRDSWHDSEAKQMILEEALAAKGA